MGTSTAAKTPQTHPAGHRAVLGGRTRADRVHARQGISLRDSGITERTRQRYINALVPLLAIIETVQSIHDLDQVCEEWIEFQWHSGQTLGSVGDALCGLQFYWPETKGCLRSSWKLYKNWRRIEIPTRAPPISALIIQSFVAYLLEEEQIAAAFIVGLGFHAYLRTGELLSLQFRDLQLGSATGIVTIRGGKSGLRHNIDEAVALYDGFVIQLGHLVRLLPHHKYPTSVVWPYSPAHFRKTFNQCVKFFDLERLNYKPYSLRRGGATHDYMLKGILEPILLRGRWHSLAVARLYLEDGLAQLPTLCLPPATLQTLQRVSRPYSHLFY